MWLVCICFFGVFLKLRNFDMNHLMLWQWLSVSCIITKCVLSVKFPFCSSYKSSAVMEVNTRSRLIWERERTERQWVYDILPFVLHATCSRFLRCSSFDRAHVRTVGRQALRLARKVCFQHSEIRLPVVLKLEITITMAPNCTPRQHWPNNGPHDLSYP